MSPSRSRVTRAGWSCKLPEPIDVGATRELRTLADIRAYLLALPEHRGAMNIWQHTARCALDEAAKTDDRLARRYRDAPRLHARALAA